MDHVIPELIIEYYSEATQNYRVHSPFRPFWELNHIYKSGWCCHVTVDSNSALKELLLAFTTLFYCCIYHFFCLCVSDGSSSLPLFHISLTVTYCVVMFKADSHDPPLLINSANSATLCDAVLLESKTALISISVLQYSNGKDCLCLCV